MRYFLVALILVIATNVAWSQSRVRTIQLGCGSIEDVSATMEKYGEKLIMVSIAPNKETVNLLFANFETQTSSWFIHDLRTDEYCMSGIGYQIHIPNDSPLNQGTGIGSKISY